jgi:hypothetical protein
MAKHGVGATGCADTGLAVSAPNGLQRISEINKATAQ